jgi:hypothetical protein
MYTEVMDAASHMLIYQLHWKNEFGYLGEPLKLCPVCEVFKGSEASLALTESRMVNIIGI